MNILYFFDFQKNINTDKEIHMPMYISSCLSVLYLNPSIQNKRGQFLKPDR